MGSTFVDPSDSTGAVGPKYYLQAINSSSGVIITLYNKTTGATIPGFVNKRIDTLNAIDVNTGPATPGLGDPVAEYDHLTGHWIVGEINANFDGLTFFVSQSKDPTGGWWHYEVDIVGLGGDPPDYPHLSVGPDAFYLGTNESTGGSPAYALNKARMESGLRLRANDVQRLTAPSLAGHAFQIITPADVEGPAPPNGSPTYFMRKNDDEINNPGGADPNHDFLEVWAFHADFSTPANSTFTEVANIPVAEFDSFFGNPDTFSAIPQPSPGPDLDPLNEPIMNRLIYRNFGTYESLVGCFVTDTTGTHIGGIRWFELRKSGASAWTEYQDGLVDPQDGASRWMGAIAMDEIGNIALGYSVASDTIDPGLRYVGRRVTDPLGAMPQGEFTLVDGSGYNGSNRWGDYFNMNVDPTDGFTFWFTGSYGLASHDWQTRIGALFLGFTISGRAYIDANGDGSDNGGTEAGINGVQIEVYDDKNADGVIDAGDALDQVLTTSTVNGVNGYYQLANLISTEHYIIIQDPVAGYGLTEPATSPPQYLIDPNVNGGFIPNANFGNFKYATITGRVFNDANGDGDDEMGMDPGQNGVVVELYKDVNENGLLDSGTDTLVDSQPTANVGGVDGVYTFNNVVGNKFIVHQAVASGFQQTSPKMPPDQAVTVDMGDTVSNVDFGSFHQITISGRAFTDVNGDGDDENGGDPGLNGVRVELYKDVNTNGTYESGTDTLVAFQFTATVGNVVGSYSFTGVGPGKYVVREIVPANQLRTAPAAPGTYAVTAVSGTDVPGLIFGNILPATLSGTVYTDVNGDGAFNGSDAGFDGVTVQLWRDVDNNGVLDTAIDTLEQSVITPTTSGVAGSYTFNNVGGGKHIIHQVLPAGYTQTSPTTNFGNYVLTTGNATVISNRDFGDFKTVTISGRAFNDTPPLGDGSGDSGSNGVTIQLFRDVNGNGMLDGGDMPAAPDTTTTTMGTPGQYKFTGVGPGRYIVHEIVPSGSVQTAPAAPGDYAVTTSSGTDVPTRDFGNFTGDLIRGRAFTDLNGNGNDDSGTDSGLNGVTINLYQDDGDGIYEVTDPFITSTTTATVNGKAGSYQFARPSGTYIIRQMPPAGYVATVPTPPSDYYAVDGTGGGLFIRDFGDFKTVTISGRKFTDLNGNGNNDGGTDPGRNGVTIELYRDNCNGQYDSGVDTFITSTTTMNIGGIDGRYQLTNVGPGPFILREAPPAGFAPTAPANGFYAVSPTSGTDVTGRDFGNFQQVTISGRVFTDVNGDGDDESGGDPGRNGVTVQLFRDVNSSGTLDGVDTMVGSTTTTTIGGIAGRYQLTGVSGGRYIVHVVPGSGNVQTSPTASGGNYAVTTVSGMDVTGRDFGTFQQITLGGRVFLDNDGDGTDNGGMEAGINSVRIELYPDHNNNGMIDSGDVLLNSTTTANIGGVDGRYSFTGIGPGSYIIREILPANFFQTAPSAPGYNTLTANSGSNVGGLDFGDFKNGSISGRTFVDRNGNGNSDGGTDPSLGGVFVDLYRDANGNHVFDSGDTFIASRASGDPSGAYSFTALLPGSYFVIERAPSGYHRTTPVSAVVVGSGADVTGIDIGNEPTKSWLAIGVDAGSVPFVRVIDTATGGDVLDFYAYAPTFRGGVRVALADVTGDGTLDIITATGPGVDPHVQVFDGRTGGLVRSFDAFVPTFTAGVWVAGGDVDGDGYADIICGAGDGGPPHVRVFSGRDLHLLASFYAYPSNVTCGARVAAGDVDGDGIAEIITGTGPGAPPHVKIFNRFGLELRGYYAYNGGYTGGVFVSTGDIDGDRRDEIITGTASSVPHVTVRDGLDLTLRGSFIAFESTSNLAVGSEGPFTTGCRVASVDRDGDGRMEIVVAAGPQRAPRVRLFDGLTDTALDSFFAFDSSLRTGLLVG